MKRFLATTLLSIAMATMAFPTLSGESVPSRTIWKGADLQTDEVVEWVYEGCAAYPVTKDVTATGGSSSSPETDLVSEAAPSGQNLDYVSHSGVQ